VVIAVLALFTLLACTPRASAQENSTTTTSPPGGVAIGDGIVMTGAVITPPGTEPPRTFDAYHAAVFTQSWLAEAYWGNPQVVDPPAGLPVYRVDITGKWGPVTGVQTVYYASDGKTAWLSWPQDQPVSPPPSTPPPPSVWWIGPPRVIDAFNGTAQLQQTTGVDQAAREAAGQLAPAESVSEGSDGSSLAWILVGVGLAVVIVGGGMFLIHRRRSSAEPVAS
jgi:hypothetical protein